MSSRQSIPSSLWLPAILLVSALAVGCGHKAGVIFPPVEPPIVWPASPEQPRVRWVGQLATDADLKPAVSGLESFRRAVFGKKGIQAMLTPFGVCSDGSNRVFVADSGAQVVHVFDLVTREYHRWQPKLPERFSQPVDVAYDPASKRLYVSDSVGAAIHIFSANGSYIGKSLPGLLVRPTGIYFDIRSRRLFVTDTGSHRVNVLTDTGQPITRFGKRGTMLGEFNFPTDVTLDSTGRIYVCDALNFRVQQYDSELRPLRAIGSQGDMPGYFSQPKAIACDAQDHLYVVDAHFEAVQVFNDAGQLLLAFGEEGQQPGQFWLPSGIFIDPSNRIWVADSYNRRIQLFEYLPESTK